MIGNISKSKGFKGDPGKTPVLGEDYYTPAELSVLESRLFTNVKNSINESRQSDWEQSDETAEDYVKNRTHYIKPTEIYSIDDAYQWWWHNPDSNEYAISQGENSIPATELTLVKGKKYLFVNDYVKHEFVFGNDEMYSSNYIPYDDGEKFSLTIEKNSNGSYMVWYEHVKIGAFLVPGYTPGTMKIYEFVHVPLDKKYLPGDVEYTGNKVTEITADNTDEQYPTAKAVYYALESHGDFELIDSAEITEDVIQITPKINGKYKKIHWIINIPIDTTNTEDVRIYFYTLNDAKTKINKQLYIMHHAVAITFSRAIKMSFSSEVYGNNASSEFLYGNKSDMEDGYPSKISTTGYKAPAVPLKTDYIEALKVQLSSAGNTRVFPAGTTYELWGVKHEKV